MARFASIAFAFLFVVASGCDDDAHYYCVASGPPADIGCFLCRGLQCWRQDPPVRPSCVAHADCGADALCSDQGCVDRCTSEDSCPLGTECTERGLCLNPTETDLTPLPEPEPKDPVQSGTGGSSGSSGGAGSGGAGEPQGFCPQTPCQQGRLCLRGECRTPCETDEDCAAVDASIRFCRPVDSRRLCVRSAEALSRCQLAIDCALGEVCEEGNCVAGSAASVP